MEINACAASGAPPAQVEGRYIRVHYLRKEGSAKDWGLHAWHEVQQPTPWGAPLHPTTVHRQEATFDVQLCPDHQKNGYSHWVGLIVHKGDEKDAGGEIVEISTDVREVWLLSGSKEVLYSEPDPETAFAGDLSRSYAHWVRKDVIAWRTSTTWHDGPVRFALHWSRSGVLETAAKGVQAGSGDGEGHADLELLAEDLPNEVLHKFPHLAGCTAIHVPPAIIQQAAKIMTAQLAISAQAADGKLITATGIQLPGLLDDLCFYSGPLGAEVTTKSTSIRLWAPTAQKVELLLFDEATGGKPHVLPMQRDEHGVWLAQGSRDWLWKYYQYRMQLFCPDVQQVVPDVIATDPYSRGLAADGRRTQIVLLDAAETLPEGFLDHTSPQQDHVMDTSIYELHVRDFSVSDASCPDEHRGKYLAFTQPGSAGCKHLQDLQQAGLSHIHLLPTYDIGSVPERAADQQLVKEDLLQYAMDGEEQQRAVLEIADHDGFNWGYDPVHYGVPEGSYASTPDGPARIREHRAMVQALHKMGLRVVLDVVYNHTFAAGQQSHLSVLDKVVPGYYHRRMENGDICMSTCCNNTASEHAMCERLIVDDITHWARNYKVDGFRFDIMGHHLVSNMKSIQQALGPARLQPDAGGVYMYGEAWDFGEVSCNQRGRNASQLNIGGLGIGSFNDRFRDSLVGGSPFASLCFQGWVNGLATRPNNFMKGEMAPQEQKEQLMEYSDLLKLGLAGNLKHYTITDRTGQEKQGKQVMYGQQPAGYALNPWETVNYADCHDGETLFDQTIMKAAEGVPIEERVLINQLATSMVALSQGIAFFHAGSDILRSKSLDRDSYNSGDWFNRVDWTLQTNNFGVGLPPASKNKAAWPLKKPRLVPELKPSPDLIKESKLAFQTMLRIRYSSPLFRLTSAEAILHQVSFGNSGTDQEPGVIVMVISSCDVVGLEAGVKDSRWKRVLVVLNATPEAVERPWPAGVKKLQLHPLLEKSKSKASLTRSKTCMCPALTASVLVEPR